MPCRISRDSRRSSRFSDGGPWPRRPRSPADGNGTRRSGSRTLGRRRGQVHHPKIESYDGYLYLILHGIDYKKSQTAFATHDIDFFLGHTYLVTVHDGQTRSAATVREMCSRNQQVLGEGPAALMHRIIDQMVDNYRPEVEELEEWLDELEQQVFERPVPDLIREILDVKRDVTGLRGSRCRSATR